MSNKNCESFYFRIFFIVAAFWSLIGCYSIQPTTTVVQDSRGHTISTNTTYMVLGDGREVVAEYGTLKEAQDKVLNLQYAFSNTMLASGNTTSQSLQNLGKNPLFWLFEFGALNPRATTYSFVTQDPTTKTTSTSTVQQDITSTGNSATLTPLPQSACNMMINGQCNPNTVTAITAVVATAVIGGITAGVISSVNSSAQKAQQEQKNKDLWSIVATTAKGAASGPSCQCNSAIQASPPYCTGAGICQCGAPNCPP